MEISPYSATFGVITFRFGLTVYVTYQLSLEKEVMSLMPGANEDLIFSGVR